MFSSDLPLFDVLVASVELKIVDVRTNLGELLEDWHDNKLDETSLTTSNISGGSVTHRRDLKVLSFFHITLVEELIEEHVSPLGRDVKLSQRSRNITGV